MYFRHHKIRIQLCDSFILIIVFTYLSIWCFLHQIMSTLLGCVIAEHASILNSETWKCSESFVWHLLRMILVCHTDSVVFYSFIRMEVAMFVSVDWKQ